MTPNPSVEPMSPERLAELKDLGGLQRTEREELFAELDRVRALLKEKEAEWNSAVELIAEVQRHNLQLTVERDKAQAVIAEWADLLGWISAETCTRGYDSGLPHIAMRCDKALAKYRQEKQK